MGRDGTDQRKAAVRYVFYRETTLIQQIALLIGACVAIGLAGSVA